MWGYFSIQTRTFLRALGSSLNVERRRWEWPPLPQLPILIRYVKQAENLGPVVTRQYPNWPFWMTLGTATGWLRRSECADAAAAPHQWAAHTSDLITMDLLRRPSATEIIHVQKWGSLFFFFTHTHWLTCGGRAVGGWVKSVEWAADRRPCALLTVWRANGEGSTSCCRERDTDRQTVSRRGASSRAKWETRRF